MSVTRNPFNSAREIRDGCMHLLGCKCETPYWLLSALDPNLEVYQAEHRRRLGMAMKLPEVSE